MGTNVSKAVGKAYRGLCIPTQNYNITTDTTATQANPRPGTAQFSGSYNSPAVFDTSGKYPNRTGSLESKLTVTTTKGGMPGTLDARHSFTPDYGLLTGHSTEVGWETPNALSRLEKVLYDTTIDPGHGCIRLQDNSILLGVLDTNQIKIYKKAYDLAGYVATGAVKWSPWALLSTITLPGTALVAQKNTVCFLQLPEGRVQLYVCVKDSTVLNQDFGQVLLWSSDSTSSTVTTWTATTKFCLRDQIPMMSTIGAGNQGSDVSRMRCAYNNGEVLLMLSGNLHNATTFPILNCTWQFASTDLGNTFDQVNLAGTVGAAYGTAHSTVAAGTADLAMNLDICADVSGQGFWVSYNQCITTAGSVGTPCVKKLGTAYTSWLDVDPTVLKYGADFGRNTVTAGANFIGGSETTIATDENGIITVASHGEYNAATAYARGKGMAWTTFDSGGTWEPYMATMALATGSVVTPTPWFDSGDVTFHPHTYSSVYQCGRWIILTFFATGSGQQEETPVADYDSIWELDLGGYSTVTRPFKESEEEDARMIQFTSNWMPAQRFQDTTGWTAAGTGTETLNTAGWDDLVTGAGQTIDRTNTTINAVATQHRTLGMCEFAVTAGVSRQQVLIGDGANILELWFEQTPTNCLVKDISAGTTLYNDVSPLAAGFNMFFFSIDWSTSICSVWLRASADDTEARFWKPILSNVAVAKFGAATASRIRVNQPADSASKWRETHWGSGVFGRPALTSAAYSIYGRAYSNYPISIYSGDGVRLRMVDGPTYDGEKFLIHRTYGFPLRDMFPNVNGSPRNSWRSDGGYGTSMDIVLSGDGAGVGGVSILGRVLAISMFNVNFKKVDVYYKATSASAWAALGTLDFSTGMTGLNFARSGDHVFPDTTAGATTSSEYFTYNQLEDCHFSDTGAAGNVLRIFTNAEGTWRDSASSLRTHLQVEEPLGAFPASGVDGEIWARDGALVIHDCPDMYSLKFTIPACVTTTGYYEIGTLVIGHVAYFGRQYARGRAVQHQPNYNLTTGRGGVRAAQSLGPSRRSVEFGWANENETDTTQLYAALPDPDYILPATGSSFPVASPADTSAKMLGIVDALRGATTPVVYFAKLDMVAAETTDQTLVNRNLFMLGRIVSEPRVETVLGDEGASASGELVRISSVVFEEEI